MRILDVLGGYLGAKASAVRARAGGAWKAQRPRGWPARDAGDPLGAEPSPADPSLPQLEVVTDPELMREVFQRHLQPLDGETYQIRGCRISYSHHRKALRCLVHYDLRLAEPDTGREWNQLVTGMMYAKGQTQHKWEKLRRSGLGRESAAASTPLAPLSYIPDLDMLVQVFPYDHLLPALPRLMAGPPPELEPLLLARFGPGDWRAEAWDVEPVRYRVGQRATLRLTARAWDAATGRVEERRFYAKAYLKEEKGEQTYHIYRKLWEKASAGSLGFTVGRPVAYLSDLRTLVQEEVPGTSLEDILRREEEEAIPAVRKAARALAALHLDDVVAPRRRHLQDEVTSLERAGKLLQLACPHLGPRIEEIVGTVVAGLEEVPLAPIHRDLKPGHFILDGDSVALIDLDKCTMADPMLDVANLLDNLVRVLPRSPRDRPRPVAGAFVEEYFAHVPEDWHARLPLHYAGILLRKAATSLRHRRPDWPTWVESRLEEAEDSLAGKVW